MTPPLDIGTKELKTRHQTENRLAFPLKTIILQLTPCILNQILTPESVLTLLKTPVFKENHISGIGIYAHYV